MNLKIYLQKTNKSQMEFAKELASISGQTIGASAVIVNRIVNDGHVPRPETVQTICKLSRGKISPNDFYDLPESPNA